MRKDSESPVVTKAARARDGLGALRHVLRRFTTPLLPDDYTQLVNPLWSVRELRGQIVSASRATEDTINLVIRPGWGVPVDFEAGQYIGIGVQIDGRYVWRSYSLTCSPRPAGDLLSITVRAVERGKLSNHLVGSAHPGMLVRIGAPAGDFHLTDPIPEKLLFITAGTGITPVISMLRTLADRSQFGDVTLIHSVRTEEDLLFADVIEKFRGDYPGFTAIVRITGRQGRLTPEAVGELVPDVAERTAYACGPNEMLDALEAWWAGLDTEEELRTERFTLDRSSEATGGEITFGHRGTCHADGATTLLEAAESVGIQLTFGCRMGICQTCVRPLTGGHVHDLRTGDIHGPGERIRTCVCVAAGDVAIDV
ncbi:ferredoxin reductase [Corynebacterium sp. CCM 9203]|uniref:ferredoxin reductase n=1 Tax=Corynebacterium sp. CCM 9203 TaxID=3057615 RepID=UPI0035235A85